MGLAAPEEVPPWCSHPHVVRPPPCCDPEKAFSWALHIMTPTRNKRSTHGIPFSMIQSGIVGPNLRW